MRVIAALLAVVMAGCSRQSHTPVVISVCDLSRDFSAYNGKIIAVRGVYFSGLRQNCPESCATGPWPSFVDLVGTDNRLPGEPPFGFTDADGTWVSVDSAQRIAEREAKQGRRVEVWLTVTGRLCASAYRSPVGPCDRVVNSGWGHLGIFPAQMVVKTFSQIEVVPNPHSPYDYSKIFRGAL
jgi:hypothetical protein